VQDPEDPCNSYQWSVVYCFMFVLSLLLWTAAISLTIYSRRRLCSPLSGIDRIAILMSVVTVIQFGPFLSSALHAGHGVYSYSQTGCKLMFYTDYGTRHVMTGLVLSLLTWAYFALHHGLDSVEGKVRNLSVGWMILAMVLVEGLFGMVPAMYIDMHPRGRSCYWTPSLNLTRHQVLSMEIIMRPLTPYLLPSLVALPLALYVWRLLAGVEEAIRKARIRCALTLVLSYFLLNVPYAIILLVEYRMLLEPDFSLARYRTVCNFKWFLFLVHQSWYLLTPLLLVLQDPTMNLPSSVSQLRAKFKKIYDDKVRLI